MEDRQEKVSRYLYSSQNTHSVHLQSEIRMLEERLKNLEYLKQTYERNAREKSLELDSLSHENFDLKLQLQESLKKIESLTIKLSNESNLLSIIEELRTNKYLLEQELNSKSSQIYEFENSLQEQYEKNLKLIDENQAIRKDLKEKEKLYNSHVEELQEKLSQISLSQRITEERVNKIVKNSTPKKKKIVSSGKVAEALKKESSLGKSLKNIIGEIYKKKNAGIEDRLLYSEKKIKELESALASTSKAEFSPPVSLQASTKLRSASQSIRNKKPRYL